MKNSLKNKLKREYEKRSEKVSVDLWDRLEAELDSTSVEKSGTGGFTSYYKYAAVLLAFVSVGLYFFVSQEESVRSSDHMVIRKEKLNEENSEIKITENVDFKSVGSPKIEENLGLKNSSSTSRAQEKIALNPRISSDQKFVEKLDSPKIEIKTFTKPTSNLAQNIEVKEKVRYTSAEDLLFGYELEKTNAELDKRSNKLGNLDLKKPKEFSILGVKIYSEETPTE